MEIEMEDGGGALRTSESDVDLKTVAEKEYSRMKRQYFLMQRNRQSLMEKAGSKSARSEKLIKLLENQKDNLESDLAAAKSTINQRKDAETKATIWKLLQVYEKYKAQVEKLNSDIESMDKTVSKMTTKFYKAKLKIQAVLGCAVSTGRLERTIENQERKLHNVKSQYDSLMTENRELKDDIATKINRRFAIFNQMNLLHKKMADCRRNLNSSANEALAVYSIWEDAARKISFIKEKYKDEVRQHLLEMKEYDRLLFHDLREIRFYSTKNKPRSLLEEAAQREARKNQKEIGTLQTEVKKYKAQFLRLEEFDPLQNVDTIIINYKNLEQKNFSYYQQISDFNRESNKVMEEIHYLKIELDQLGADKHKQELMNEQELRKLELSRDTEQQKLEHLQSQLDVTDESTQRIVEAIEAFFDTEECDMGQLQEFLGNNSHITTKNLRHAFNLLEHHIASMQLEKELLSIQKDLETRTTEIPPKPPKIYRAVGGPFEPNIVISGRPELGMEKQDDEEDIIFTTSRIPKAVQREHLLAQLRDLGIIATPKVFTASESAAALTIQGKGKRKGHRPQPKSDNENDEVEADFDPSSEQRAESDEQLRLEEELLQMEEEE